MKGKWKRWLPALRKVFLREAVVLVCAAAMGLGWSLFTSEHYLPTMDGNVYAMDPTDNSLFMVVSKDANNSLVHIDYEGNVFHYAVTETNQAFENLAILGDTIYAVLTTYNKSLETCEMIVADLAEVGITATIETVDNATFNGAMGSRSYPGEDFPWGMVTTPSTGVRVVKW